MRKKKNEFEKKASNYNLIPIFFMAVSGIIGGILSNSSAIFIDGAFSAVLFFTIFLGKWIQLQIIKPKNNDYPVGRSRLGSLYVLFKILILIGILSYSFIDSGFIIIKYAGGNYTPELVDVYYARIYYVVKTIAFIISFALYTYYLKQTNYQSTILRVDRKGTVIDGGITLGIMSGFFFLGKIPLVAPISDSIILLFLSVFLILEMLHSFKNEIQSMLGKRIYIDRENYYYGLFNHYFDCFHFFDIYITKSGDQHFCSVYLTYDGVLSASDIMSVEKQIEYEMEKEFDDIILNIYFSNKNKYDSSKV